MRESVERSFFVLAYEHIVALLPLALLRALPWTALGLWVSFGPTAAAATRGQLIAPLAIALIAILAAPWTGAACRLVVARLCRGEAPEPGGALRAGRARYVPQLVWTVVQALLLLLVIRNTLTWFAMPPGSRGFMMHLGLAAGFWLWALARLWNFVWMPLLVDAARGARPSARLALMLILGEPTTILRGFLMRQALGLVLILSGLGIFFGLGSLLPLHAALSVRAALRARGLNGPATDGDLDLESLSWRKILRPWE